MNDIFPFRFKDINSDKFEPLLKIFLIQTGLKRDKTRGFLKITFESERVISFELYKEASIFSKLVYEQRACTSASIFVDIDFSRPYIEERLREMALEEIKEEEKDRLEKDIANRIKKIKKQYKKDELFTQL